jgi:hypothetical protein
MGFYSAVEARKPYERHQPYTILNGQLILHQGARTQDIVSMWQLTTLYLPAFGNVPYLAERISSAKSAAAILAPFERQPYDVNGKVFDVSGWTRLDLNAALVQIPAYPSPPARIIAHAALVASYDRTLDIVRAAGAGVTYNSQIERTQLQIEVSGFAVPKIELLYRPDPWANGDGEPLLPLPGTLDGKTFTVDDPDFRPGPGSWTPVVIRVREGENGEPFDFFGPILYR